MKKSIFLGLLYFGVQQLHANVPTDLVGTWLLDRAGTSEMYRNSPDWNSKKERYLGDIIDYISRYRFVFKGNSLERHFYRETLSWDFSNSERDSSVITFASKNKEGKEVEVQITQMGEGLIHIRIGQDDNYRLCAWRKKPKEPPKKEVPFPSVEDMLKKMMEEEGRGTKEI